VVLWYLRSTVRELGSPQACLDGTYQYALLNAVERRVIEEQLNYHRANAVTLARMSHWLHKSTNTSFILALGILLLYFIGWPLGRIWELLGKIFSHYPSSIMHSVTFTVAFLPALGAALAGIRDTGDFQGSAHRSARTITALENLRFDLESAKRNVSLDESSTILVAIAQVLSEDLAAWQSIYSAKRLNLPV
jgi:hypothetical protein